MKTPVAIVGGGPGGSAAAMFLAQKGIEDFINLFAARIYLDRPSRGLMAMHTLTGKSNELEISDIGSATEQSLSNLGT